MRVKIKSILFEYLKNIYFSEDKELIQNLSHEIVGEYVNIEISTETMDRIRDWAGERQQRTGYDINYELNNEGKILEELIDTFHVK